jgi:nitrous oxide reductase accessory protein NosL
MRLTVLVLLSILALSPCGWGEEGTAPAAPGEKDRCPVCGMFVAPFRNWVAAAVLADGRTLFFDGPKDLLRFRFDPVRYRSAPEKIAALHVTDYYTLRLIPAGEAFFVIGSDVLGPMGHELVPLATREAAESFRRDHGGDIVSFAEITPATLPGME